MKTFIVCVICLCCVLLSNGIEVLDTSNPMRQTVRYQVLSPNNQQGRPLFHFRPPNNWINDPNGPMYYKGLYHLFYQYNPYGATFNEKTIVWGHAVSRDLINWDYLTNALVPTNSFDIYSCFSGSTTILPGNKPVILYTGVDAKNQQVQNLAKPKNLSDPFLEEWVKYSGNPLMTPPPGVKPDMFRDPTTAWKAKDRKWRVVVGSSKGKVGMAIVYRSKDFLHWSLHDGALYSGQNTDIWECPDFFPVIVNSKNGAENSANRPNLKYVIKASLNGHDYYSIGRYAFDKDKFTPDHIGITGRTSDLRYDYGQFYASKTFFDRATKRRILWGWIKESDNSTDDIKKGWAGIQSIPRQLFLSTTGTQLIQWPVEETKRLRDKHVTYHGKKLKGHSLYEVSGITASQADVEVSFVLPKLEDVESMDPKRMSDPQLVCSTKTTMVRDQAGPFGLLVMASQDLKEQTSVFFRIFKYEKRFIVLMCSDQSRSSLSEGIDKATYGAFVDIDPKQKMISLRSLVDESIIESFGDEGKACITVRVYPKFSGYEEAHLYAFNNGSLDVVISKLDAWSMKRTKN